MKHRILPTARRLAGPLVCAIAAALAGTAHAQGHAHEHGAAKLDIAVELGQITVQLESPLDNLLGFEHAPRNEGERRKVDAMVARLKAADVLFKIDPAAGCSVSGVDLVSAPLKLGSPGPGAKDDGHGDLDGDFTFACKDSARAAFIDVALFAAFTAVQRLDVQLATPKGQARRTLKRPAARIDLPR